MKLHAHFMALLIAAASYVSFGACAATDAEKPGVQADTPAAAKLKPHSHMQEKTGMMPQKDSAAPESDKTKVAKAKTDKQQHLHPRDAK